MKSIDYEELKNFLTELIIEFISKEGESGYAVEKNSNLCKSVNK